MLTRAVVSKPCLGRRVTTQQEKFWVILSQDGGEVFKVRGFLAVYTKKKLAEEFAKRVFRSGAYEIEEVAWKDEVPIRFSSQDNLAIVDYLGEREMRPYVFLEFEKDSLGMTH